MSSWPASTARAASRRWSARSTWCGADAMRCNSSGCTMPICSPARAASARPRSSRILAKSLNCTGPDGHGGITATPCGVCQRLHRDRRRPLPRLHRARRRQQPRHRRDPRPARTRRLQARHRPLQGLHDRRGAPAHQGRLQRAAEDAGRAARLPEVRAGHHRPREDAAHGAEPLPAVQPAADGAGGGARTPAARAAGRRRGQRRRGRCACWRAPRAARCATACR